MNAKIQSLKYHECGFHNYVICKCYIQALCKTGLESSISIKDAPCTHVGITTKKNTIIVFSSVARMANPNLLDYVTL